LTDINTKFYFSETTVYRQEKRGMWLFTHEKKHNIIIYEYPRHKVLLFRRGIVLKPSHFRDFLLIAYGAHKEKIGLNQQGSLNVQATEH
jgi:hypothetical protein